jgi:L-2-hydroxyglutarate oxidase LhgO
MSTRAAGNSASERPDVVLIGAGIMSATLGTILKELEPALDVVMFETLHDCALESSEAWNNAGTGHAANCELNYTPRRPDGSVDISRALQHTGVLEFGTELIGSADNSIVALLGASPGASTAAFIATEVLEKCFGKELAGGWRDKLRAFIPTYGIDLTQDAAACRETRAKTAAVLGLTNI